MEVLSPRPPGKLTARVIIERHQGEWKPYTISIWIRGRWICSQDFWRRTDCDVIRHIMRDAVDRWNQCHGFDLAGAWEQENSETIQADHAPD
jgi:hypothetical protein